MGTDQYFVHKGIAYDTGTVTLPGKILKPYYRMPCIKSTVQEIMQRNRGATNQLLDTRNEILSQKLLFLETLTLTLGLKVNVSHPQLIHNLFITLL